jgi:AraC-like DNA-binding protein
VATPGPDILSDVLRSVRFRGAVFYDVTGGEDWVAEAPPARDLAPVVMPGMDHVVEYHVILRGECWAAIVGEEPLKMSAGDVVIFPRGDAHVMSARPGRRGPPLDPGWVATTRDVAKPIPLYIEGPDSSLRAGAPQGAMHVVCGFIGCDLRPFNPLFATLPRLLHLPAAAGDAWVAQLLAQALAESRGHRAGGEAMLQRISEMMFVDGVRRHVDALSPESTGWLAALRDRHVGRALAVIHEAPACAWTVDSLATEAALSRSALHERFAELVGLAPMQYLANWRMQLASGLLRATDATVASIALDVGYDSEAAFSRAFKRLVGEPPAAWRRAQRRAGRTAPPEGAAAT